MASRYGEDLGSTDDLSRFEYRVFSQNGEDGIIGEILHRIGVSSRWFVEFGADRGIEGNCVLLADIFAWSGLFMEGDGQAFANLRSKYKDSDRVRTVHTMVSPDNVDILLHEAGVPTDLDVLSIDVDGPDYWIWQALSEFRPRLVVIEYNSTLDPGANLVQPLEQQSWDGTNYFGASLGALIGLAKKKGYTFVHSDLTGVNAFFIRDDLMAHIGPINPPRRGANFFFQRSSHAADPLDRSFSNVDPL